jgi:hypothetical protein
VVVLRAGSLSRQVTARVRLPERVAATAVMVGEAGWQLLPDGVHRRVAVVADMYPVGRCRRADRATANDRRGAGAGPYRWMPGVGADPVGVAPRRGGCRGGG